MTLHKKQEKICKQLGDHEKIAISWWNQGNIHGQEGNRQKQVELWQKSIAVNKKIGIPTEEDEKYLAELLEEMNSGKGK